MKKIRWQLIIIFLTGIVVGILLLGEQPTPVQQNVVNPEPVQGGIYTEAAIGSVQRLNPLLDYQNQVDRDINRLIFCSLLRFDDRGNPVADLAESWGVSKDGTIYNFSLRKNIFWHDGQPVTTRDVVFTVEMMRQGGDIVPKDLQELWKEIVVKDLNETTLQFQLPEPFSPFLDYLTFGVLPEHLLGKLNFDEMVGSAFNLQPVGSGPYKFDRLVIEDGQITGVILQAYNKYYGANKAFIDQLVFRFYPNHVAALQAYRDEAVQGIGSVSDEILADALVEPGLALYTSRRPEMSLVLFNLKDKQSEFLQSPQIRRALYMGLNRQRMVNSILNGQAILATGPIFPGTWAYYDGLKPVEYNPDQAITILKNAGYILADTDATVREKDEVQFSFTLLHPDDEQHTLLAEAIQADWATLGVQVLLESLPYDTLLADRLRTREYQAALVDLNLTRSPDPDPYPFWDQAQAVGGQNYTQWDNRIASEYLEQARITVDRAERARLYRNFQVVFDEELPALPLFYPVYSFAVSRDIQGVRVGPLFDTSDRFNSITSWFLNIRAPAPRITSTPEP